MGYWQDRQEAMYKAGEMQVNQYFSRLERAFNQTKRELQKTVESFYWRYAEENGLSYAAAQKRLDKAEIGELRDFIELSMANIGKYSQEVNNLSIKARITRYQALEAQVDAILRQLYAIDYEATAEQTMNDVYDEAYYRTWYNIDQYRGFHSAFAQVDPVTVEKLMEYPFNGANFSSRLWKQKDHLQSVLMESITTILIQGKPPQKLAADFAKKMQSKKFDAYRLLHTESSFLMSEAAHAGYREDGVEKYQILATLDSKTCGICGDLDGNVYVTEKAVTGVNMPPFHPLCRCTDVPYYDDTDLSDQTRAARDPETGETYGVPADMTYKEWHKKYVDQIRDESVAKDSGSGIIKSANTKEEEPVHSVGKIDRNIYKCITDDIRTDEVIITDERIDHIIKRRGQEFFDTYGDKFADIIKEPDYIFEDRANTALVCKGFANDGKFVNVVLRIAVSADDPNYKNSILTAVGESDKRFRQRLRNNKPLYKKE